MLVCPGLRGFWDVGSSVLKLEHSQANWGRLGTLIRGKLCQDLFISLVSLKGGWSKRMS